MNLRRKNNYRRIANLIGEIIKSPNYGSSVTCNIRKVFTECIYEGEKPVGTKVIKISEPMVITKKGTDSTTSSFLDNFLKADASERARKYSVLISDNGVISIRNKATHNEQIVSFHRNDEFTLDSLYANILE